MYYQTNTAEKGNVFKFGVNLHIAMTLRNYMPLWREVTERIRVNDPLFTIKVSHYRNSHVSFHERLTQELGVSPELASSELIKSTHVSQI